jgi:hypothetical protein
LYHASSCNAHDDTVAGVPVGEELSIPGTGTTQ